MTQAEKAQLRYYAIMTQVTTAQGDMARTLDAPANQLRILSSQVTQAARAFGNIFIPILNKVLPYLIAGAKVFRIFASTVASLLGFEMPEVDYSNLGAVTSGAEDASDAIDDTTDSAKKLNKILMGFDELNVINSSDASSSLKDAFGDGFDFELPKYDFLDGVVETRVNKIVEDMKKWLGLTGEIDSWADLFDTKLGKVIKIAAEIGTVILAWKLASTLFNGAQSITNFLKSADKALTSVDTMDRIMKGFEGAVLITIGVMLAYDAGYKTGLGEADLGTCIEAMLGVAAAGIGGAMIGSAIFPVGGTVIGAITGVAIGLIAEVVGVIKGNKQRIINEYYASDSGKVVKEALDTISALASENAEIALNISKAHITYDDDIEANTGLAQQLIDEIFFP